MRCLVFKRVFSACRDATLLRNEKGASAVEMAIVLPLLLILLFGIIEFGLVLYDKAVITNASREGARYGIVSRSPRYTPTEIRDEVQPYWSRLVTFGEQGAPVVTVTATDVDGNGNNTDFGDDLEVLVTWHYEFLLLPDLPGIGLSHTMDLSARTVMKYE